VAERATGTVKCFDGSKGYGYIVPEQGEDVFVHYTAITDGGLRNLTAGDQVEFSIEDDPRLMKFLKGRNTMSENLLKIIPLGGLGEVGKNMMVLEYDRQILIVDAGLMFPENDMLGIDLVIPDFGYLLDKIDWVRGIIITHGHEDHTGALPYVLQHIHAPIYTTKLTRGLIEVKLSQHHLLQDTNLNTIRPGDEITVGPFRVEFFHVCHSIPDGVGLAIQTPVGLVVHSGDFKLDHTPVDGKPPDFAKLAELGGRGVLALLSDSTNVERPGTTPSERVIDTAFDQVFQAARGRIIVATFASLISRIQQVVNCAVRHERRVAIAGRTMVQNVRMARQLGYLEIPPNVLLTPSPATRRWSTARSIASSSGAQTWSTKKLHRYTSRATPARRSKSCC